MKYEEGHVIDIIQDIWLLVVDNPAVEYRIVNSKDSGSIPGLCSGISEIIFVIIPTKSAVLIVFGTG